MPYRQLSRAFGFVRQPRALNSYWQLGTPYLDGIAIGRGCTADARCIPTGKHTVSNPSAATFFRVDEDSASRLQPTLSTRRTKRFGSHCVAALTVP
jgi:biotin synthase-related radical SAM superfamily protein